MEFSPEFSLLQNFTIGLPKTPKTEDEVRAVSKYLGVVLPDTGLDDQVRFLSAELSNQNRFLSTELSTDSIYDTDEYRKSLFVREIVANNRVNRWKRSNSRDR